MAGYCEKLRGNNECSSIFIRQCELTLNDRRVFAKIDELRSFPLSGPRFLFLQNLSRKQQEQQEVLWELVTTELNYIKKTCCVVELQACVSALQTDGFLTDVDCDCVFGNILDICRANLRFWLQCFHPLLQYSRQTGEPLDPTKLEAGFQNLDRLFNPYIPFCLHHVEMLCYIRRKQKESELFREFILVIQKTFLRFLKKFRFFLLSVGSIETSFRQVTLDGFASETYAKINEISSPIEGHS